MMPNSYFPNVRECNEGEFAAPSLMSTPILPPSTSVRREIAGNAIDAEFNTSSMHRNAVKRNSAHRLSYRFHFFRNAPEYNDTEFGTPAPSGLDPVGPEKRPLRVWSWTFRRISGRCCPGAIEMTGRLRIVARVQRKDAIGCERFKREVTPTRLMLRREVLT